MSETHRCKFVLAPGTNPDTHLRWDKGMLPFLPYPGLVINFDDDRPVIVRDVQWNARHGTFTVYVAPQAAAKPDGGPMPPTH